MHIEELKRIVTDAVAECGELMRVVPDTLDELDALDARDAIVAAVNRANDPTEIVQALGRRINDDADLVIDALVVRSVLDRLLGAGGAPSDSDLTNLEGWIKDAWANYQSGGYTGIGRLNLVASIGERGGAILALIEQLRRQNRELRGRIAAFEANEPRA